MARAAPGKFDAGATIHRALESLQPVDLAFHLLQRSLLHVSLPEGRAKESLVVIGDDQEERFGSWCVRAWRNDTMGLYI
jgi:hypothetical protein